MPTPPFRLRSGCRSGCTKSLVRAVPVVPVVPVVQRGMRACVRPSATLLPNMALTPQERRTRDAERKRRARAADRESLGLPPPPPPLSPKERRQRHADRMKRYRKGRAAERQAFLDQRALALDVVEAMARRVSALVYDQEAGPEPEKLLRRVVALRGPVASWDGKGPALPMR